VRYLIYGVTGSGKTTLAREVAARTGLPWHAVDDLTWQPGWVQVPDDEQRRILERVCADDAWILDHAYGSWVDVPLARASVVVALDYPRLFSLWRVTRRSIVNAMSRRPTCGDNVETWRTVLSRESMIVCHFKSFRRKRDRIRKWAEVSPGPRLVRLRSRRQTRRWVASLERVA
jgi:adenylate kinase family enzyme